MLRSCVIPVLTVVLCFVFAVLATSNTQARVTINGYHLDSRQVASLERHLGTRVVPGHYLVDGNGCWVNLSNGASGCPGAEFGYDSGYGSGGHSGEGSWNHWSDAAEGGVGGTSDGCVYTTYGWSNC